MAGGRGWGHGGGKESSRWTALHGQLSASDDRVQIAKYQTHPFTQLKKSKKKKKKKKKRKKEKKKKALKHSQGLGLVGGDGASSSIQP